MQLERKNLRVRREMAAAGIDQRKLSNLMHITEMECSVMLKRELAKTEQDELIRIIKEYRA